MVLTDHRSVLVMSIMYSFGRVPPGLGFHIVNHAVDSDHSVCKINSMDPSGALCCLLLRAMELLTPELSTDIRSARSLLVRFSVDLGLIYKPVQEENVHVARMIPHNTSVHHSNVS